MLTLDAYQDLAVGTDVSKGRDSASFLLLGLFGEAGSVLTEVKKRERDRTRTADYIARVTEEIGDLLWYMNAVAARNGIRLSEIASLVHAPRGSQPLVDPSRTFRSLQPERKTIQLEPNLLLEWHLVDLAESVGQLVYDHRQFLKDRVRDPLVRSFARVLTEILGVANRVGIDLEAAARGQLRKAQERWPTRKRLPPYPDGKFPEYERLPRELIVEIREEKLAGDNYFVFQRCNGINVGDRLTDNIADPDDYRFHDVFHYAYAAVLGWSPVIRALYKLKRKSKKEIDESQDGARAALIEEGIATLVFNEAKRNNFFLGVKRGRLSFDLLKTVHQFVQGYEVQKMPYWAWEEAILQGFDAFRFLHAHRSGRLVLKKRRIVMEPL
jgi:NTP pyrophosphatase (non-canonical NTP hydrolase)